MAYSVVFSKESERALARLDNSVRALVVKWLAKHLDGCENPRATGKPLSNNLSGFWRYRVGDYRIIAEIRDDELVILVIALEHRSVAYKR